jgi:S-adenosylmethionine hydrolase
MKIITFLSDFGLKSSYVSQMKGIALSMTDAKLVDISHEITHHNIYEGAFVLKTSIPYFPAGTVHIGVIDPGVGSSRKGIVVTTSTHIFVGPDNGLLIPAAKILGKFTVYEIKNQELMLNNVSNTFHGRDIFTPVAAHILNGVYFDEIGPIIKDYVDLNFEITEIKNKIVMGQIIYIDGFGNIITNIEKYKIRPLLEYDKELIIFTGRKKIKLPFVKTYSSVRKGEALATIGSNDYLEISVNQGNASKLLNVKAGDKVKIFLA